MMVATVTAMAHVLWYGSYIMWLMMPYLTDVWNLSIMEAAGVVNIFDGTVAIIPLCFKLILESVGNQMAGDYWGLLVCGISSTLGFGLVTMSTPSVLSELTGGCNEDEPKCISDANKGLLFSGLVFLAIGMSACITSVRPYISKRAEKMGLRERSAVRQSLVQNDTFPTSLAIDPRELRSRAYDQWPSEYWSYLCNGTFFVILLILVLWVTPWPLRFGIPAVVTAMITLMFISKSWYWISESQLQEEEEEPFSRAATNARAWCVVRSIGKLVIDNLSWCTIFVIAALVSSIGNTYFIEQANQMDSHLGSWNIPPAFFIIFYKLVNILFTNIWQTRLNPAPARGIAFSIVISIICCVVAAIVERIRLSVAASDGMIDDAEAKVPLSMFVMLPQFFLLAVFDAAYSCCVFAFFHQRAPKGYANSLMHLLLGAGFFCNVVSVFLAGRFSGRGDNSWFQHTLNKSRLDNYYWTIAILSAITLAFCYFVAIRKANERGDSALLKQSPSEPEDMEELEFKHLEWFELLPLRQ